MATVEEFALLSTHVYLDGAPLQIDGTRWQVLSVALPAGSEREGFFARAYQRGDEIVIAFRGTDNLLNDADESIAAYAGIPPRQVDHAQPRYDAA